MIQYPRNIKQDLKKALIQRLNTLPKNFGLKDQEFVFSKLEKLSDEEEALRLAMVVYLKKLRTNNISNEDLLLLLDCCKTVSEACYSGDLRFVDSLNVLHESWSQAAYPKMRIYFNILYVNGLINFISLL